MSFSRRKPAAPNGPSPQSSMDFNLFDAEVYIAKRLKDHGVRVFDGVSDVESRKALIRAAIIGGKRDCVIVGRNSKTGKSGTYAQLFERVYGEPLVPAKPRRKAEPA